VHLLKPRARPFAPRFVGAVFRIKALTGSPQNEDADNDAVLVGHLPGVGRSHGLEGAVARA
jgi:hypothetical protein